MAWHGSVECGCGAYEMRFWPKPYLQAKMGQILIRHHFAAMTTYPYGVAVKQPCRCVGTQTETKVAPLYVIIDVSFTKKNGTSVEFPTKGVS